MSRLNNDYRAIGNLGQDPESGKFENGTTWCRFPLAINDGYKSQSGEWTDKTVWLDCKAFGPTADRLTEQLKKGNTIHISGKIQSETWQDKTGNTRKSVYVLIENAKKLDLIKRTESTQQQSASNVDVNQLTDGNDDLPF